MMVNWTQGFLTAMNYSHDDPVPLPHAESIARYMLSYCQTHPLKRPLDGAAQLYRALRKSQAGA